MADSQPTVSPLMYGSDVRLARQVLGEDGGLKKRKGDPVHMDDRDSPAIGRRARERYVNEDFQIHRRPEYRVSIFIGS